MEEVGEIIHCLTQLKICYKSFCSLVPFSNSFIMIKRVCILGYDISYQIKYDSQPFYTYSSGLFILISYDVAYGFNTSFDGCDVIDLLSFKFKYVLAYFLFQITYPYLKVYTG